MKTPLAVLRGYAELLASGRGGDVLQEAPAAILEASRRLAPAVDDLLLALEIKSGLETDLESVDLAGLVPNGTKPLSVSGDARLLKRAVEILGSDTHEVSVTVADDVATVVAGQGPRNQLELYVARLIAEAHGGELRESSTGLAMTLPLS